MNNSIAVIGDVMLDHYIIGQCHRISPEAPVPIVNISSEHYGLGGAANLAHNICNFGNPVCLFGAVGEDTQANQVKRLLGETAIHTRCQIWEKPTTTKTRVVVQQQQMIRLDQEQVTWQENENHKSDILKVLENENIKAVIISDYAKGFCTEGLVSTVIEKCNHQSISVFVDPKGNDWKKYRGAFLIKPNIAELEAVTKKSLKHIEDITQAAITVAQDYSIDHVVVTLGNKGMLWIHTEQVDYFPAEKIEIYDVSGAGDTAMAALCHMYSHGHDLEKSIRIANKAAAIAVSKLYTYALTKEEFQALI